MKDILCYSIDAESKEGSVIASRFGVTGYPTLLFLESNGEVRDLIGGFLPAEPFSAEIQRIKRNEFTLSGLKLQLQANPLDLDVRWAYAQKLESIGDDKGYEREIASIKKNDPEGTSIGSRSLRFQEIKKQCLKALALQDVYDFLKVETNTDLLLDGWYFLFKVESYLADNAEDDEAQTKHRELQISAARALWSQVPGHLLLHVAEEIITIFLNAPQHLTRAHKGLLLEVGKTAAGKAPSDPSVLAMYGECLFTLNRQQEAILQLKRCVEIDPKNTRWRHVLARYAKGG